MNHTIKQLLLSFWSIRRFSYPQSIIFALPFGLFVCLFWVFRPTRAFFTHLETSPLLVKGCKFWPMLGTHAIERWGFFGVPYLLWHGASVYNGHLQGPVTLTPIAEHLAVELSLPVFMTWVHRSWDSNTQLSLCEANTLTHSVINSKNLIYTH